MKVKCFIESPGEKKLKNANMGKTIKVP